MLALRDHGRPPCRYVAGVIDPRLGEITKRIAELRELKRELSDLRERMRRDAVTEADGDYCHYIETAAAAARGPLSDAPSR